LEDALHVAKMGWQEACGHRLALLSIILTSVIGCRTAPNPGINLQVGPDWRVRSGQAIWLPRPGRPELAGEIMLASGPAGESYLEFTKGPLPLVTAMRDGNGWSVKFPDANRAHAGRGKPPSQIAWLYLRQALMGENLPSALKFEQTADGNWELQNTRTGETMKGFLSP
jgi:hypothetical protein